MERVKWELCITPKRGQKKLLYDKETTATTSAAPIFAFACLYANCVPVKLNPSLLPRRRPMV